MGPVFMTYLLVCKKVKHYKKPRFMLRWGAFFDDVKIFRKDYAAYYLIYMLRRIAFLANAILVKTRTYQILFLWYQNLAMLVYIGRMPLRGMVLTRVNMLEELLIVIFCLSTYCFMLPLDPWNKTVIGWFLIGIFTITFILHFILLLFSWLQTLWMLGKRYYNRIYEWWFQKFVVEEGKRLAEKLGYNYDDLVKKYESKLIKPEPPETTEAR